MEPAPVIISSISTEQLLALLQRADFHYFPATQWWSGIHFPSPVIFYTSNISIFQHKAKMLPNFQNYICEASYSAQFTCQWNRTKKRGTQVQLS